MASGNGAQRGQLPHGLWAALGVRRVMFLALSLVVLQLAIASTAQADPMPIGVPGSWAMKFDEEFTSAGLNTSVWTPDWYQGQMAGQCTSPNLVSQPGNGYLYLQVRAQASECSGIHNSNTGALVESDPGDGVPGHSGFKYSYGYVEWHVWVPGASPSGWTCPTGGCMADWPALWSFPENEETEIDTMEGLREVKTGKTCAHFWRHSPAPEYQQGKCVPGSFAGAWHTFGADWEPNSLQYYYDGTKVWEYNSSDIKSTPQYLIMNDVPEGSHGGPLVVPSEMTVDYVRVWQHPPPTATTSAASEVGETTAKLNGSVNPNGLDTHYYFEYGPTTTFGHVIPAAPGMDIGKNSESILTWNTISGLQPGVTYHYRVVASSAAGTSVGTESTFTTLGPRYSATTSGGITYVLWEGSNADLWEKWYVPGTHTWNGPKDLGMGPLGGPPRAVGTANGDVHVFWKGDVSSNYGLYQAGYNASTGKWSEKAESLGGSPMGSDPSPVQSSAGTLDVFWKGTDGALYHKWFLPSTQSWNGPQSLGMAPLGGPPQAVGQSNGNVNVFWKGDVSSNYGLYQAGYNASTGKWSEKAESLGGSPMGSDPSPVQSSAGTLDVFWKGTDGALYHKWFLPSTQSWNGPQSLGMAPLGGPPQAVGQSNGNVNVFWKGDVSSNYGLYQAGYNASTGKWSEKAESLGGSPMGSDPSPAAVGSGNLEAFWNGTDNNLWHEAYSGGSWSLPVSLGSG